mmetsp:Transcript_4101/g.9724  ORF Transcript_4101/g.9724 Transcript_4101/m.9724 type:complete len:202 (+) Transcript_4101:1307-1912(+)
MLNPELLPFLCQAGRFFFSCLPLLLGLDLRLRRLARKHLHGQIRVQKGEHGLGLELLDHEFVSLAVVANREPVSLCESCMTTKRFLQDMLQVDVSCFEPSCVEAFPSWLELHSALRTSRQTVVPDLDLSNSRQSAEAGALREAEGDPRRHSHCSLLSRELCHSSMGSVVASAARAGASAWQGHRKCEQSSIFDGSLLVQVL